MSVTEGPSYVVTVRLILFLILALGIAAPLFAAPASHVQKTHMRAALVAENQALVPGQTNWVGVELTPQHGWHSYWRNPGEAGLPTHIKWTLPSHATAGAIQWPAPKRLETTGLVDYGYDQSQLLMVPVHLPKSMPTQNAVAIKAHVSWLVCKDICVPGGADLALHLPTSSGPPKVDPATASLFSKARSRLPKPLPQEWSAHYTAKSGHVNIGLSGKNIPGSKLAFYPITKALVNYSAPQHSARDASGLRVSMQQSRRFKAPDGAIDGVIEITAPDNSVQAYRIQAQPGVVAPVTAAPSTSTVTSLGIGFALALLFAFVGGIILNLMPCVFPVLSIKALGVMKSSTLQRSAQRQHGLAYAAGTILACVVAAGALLGLRAGGEALGWGFQLQSPVFVALLACLMFALGLSLSGVVQFGTRLMGVGQSLTQSGDLRGAFFTGVLAVIVASPCTAPFMGTAMGYALAQPAAAALAIFAALGLGLALPFLIIGFVPQLAGWLPKPGAWMETFKQLMAFPLYLTVVWLVWVVARQSGPDAAALVMAALVVLALVLWARGHWPQSRISTAVLALGVIGVIAMCSQTSVFVPESSSSVASGEVATNTNMKPWSPSRVAALRKDGRTIFVDFTADWCLTCKVNEHVTLDSSAVHKAFARNNVVYLKADWTSRDPVITKALRHYGRAGVPLYVVFKNGGKPEVLPQLLTKNIVADAVGG